MAQRAFKSVAERTRLQKLMHEGTFPRQDFDAMAAASEGQDLPERLTTKRGHMDTKSTAKLSTGGSSRYTQATKPHY